MCAAPDNCRGHLRVGPAWPPLPTADVHRLDRGPQLRQMDALDRRDPRRDGRIRPRVRAVRRGRARPDLRAHPRGPSPTMSSRRARSSVESAPMKPAPRPFQEPGRGSQRGGGTGLHRRRWRGCALSGRAAPQPLPAVPRGNGPMFHGPFRPSRVSSRVQHGAPLGHVDLPAGIVVCDDRASMKRSAGGPARARPRTPTVEPGGR